MAPLKSRLTVSNATDDEHSVSNEEPQNSSVQVAVRIRPLFAHETDRRGYLQLRGQNDSDTPLPFPGRGPMEKGLSDQSNGTVSTYLQRTGSDSTSSSFLRSYSASEPIVSFKTLAVGEGESSQNYTFDHVFPDTSRQEDIFEKCVTPLVQSCLEGYNATVLAYGQTGSGKTHTILGDVNNPHSIDEEESFTDSPEFEHVDMRSEAGVIPRALRSVFDGLEDQKLEAVVQAANASLALGDFGRREDDSSPRRKRSMSSSHNSGQSPFEFSINIQFVELYGEEIRDLLHVSKPGSTRPISGNGGRRVRTMNLKRYNSTGSILSSDTSGWKYDNERIVTIRDGKAGEGAELIGAETIEVKSVQEALDHLKAGLSKRVVGRTAMNAHSSRSHAIFSVIINQTMRRPMKGIGGDGEKVSVEMKTSKIHFVDLCGSERVKRAETAGKR